MITSGLYQASIRLLGSILASPGAADAHMDRFFRSEPKLGTADRGTIAELVYGTLRRHRLLTTIAHSEAPAAVLAAYLAAESGYNARQLRALGVADPDGLIAAARRPRADYPFAIRASLPDWFAEDLLALLGPAEAAALAESLLAPAPLDLRCNTLKTDRAALQAALARAGHELHAAPLSPWGLRRTSRAGLFRTAEFAAGHFEIQDEGSQLIAPLLEPRRGERVVDYCAGAGGKTLHIAALLTNTGTIYACDTAQRRLDRLRERAARAGCDNLRILTLSGSTDTRLKRLHGKIDRVLVDAPCSGTGTLRRSPDIKWRLDAQRVARLAHEAGQILADAARLVRPGGRLVYATCSLLPAENEDVITAFLASHPEFTALDTPAILARRAIPLPAGGEGPGLRLWPHRHGTDGFYAQALERIATPPRS